MELAGRTYLLADHTKFGVRSLSFYGDLGMADVLITDNGADEQCLASLRSAGVEIEIATS